MTLVAYSTPDQLCFERQDGAILRTIAYDAICALVSFAGDVSFLLQAFWPPSGVPSVVVEPVSKKQQEKTMSCCTE